VMPPWRLSDRETIEENARRGELWHRAHPS
jgi:hypothetical protein